jgi:hypothetical protein
MPDNDTAITVNPSREAVAAAKAPRRVVGTVWTVVVLLAWMLAVYFPTTLSMVTIWERSETFAHGFVVIPIFLYLLWRQRDALATIETTRCLPALLGIAGAGMVWFIGEQVHAIVVSQLAVSRWFLRRVVGVGHARRSGCAFPWLFCSSRCPSANFWFRPSWTGPPTSRWPQSGRAAYRSIAKAIIS